MKSGIYKIENIENGKVYIGQAINIKKRFYVHRSLLRRNKHPNNYLQNSWNKHGESKFRFMIIEKISDKFLLTEQEQYHIDLYKKNGQIDHSVCYNILPEAKDSTGYKHTEKSKQKMIENRSGITEEDITYICESYKNGTTTIQLAKEFNVTDKTIGDHLERCGIARRVPKGENNGSSKLTRDDVKEIRDLYLGGDYTQKDLADQFNVQGSNITLIVTNQTWYDPNYNIKEAKKISKKNKESTRGSNNGNSKLNEQKIKQIREKYKTGNYTYKKLAEEYSVFFSTIGKIVKRKIWDQV